MKDTNKRWFIGKDPVAGKDERRKEKGAAEDEIDSIIESVNMNLSKFLQIVKDKWAWHTAVHGVIKSWIQLSD